MIDLAIYRLAQAICGFDGTDEEPTDEAIHGAMLLAEKLGQWGYVITEKETTK